MAVTRYNACRSGMGQPHVEILQILFLSLLDYFFRVLMVVTVCQTTSQNAHFVYSSSYTPAIGILTLKQYVQNVALGVLFELSQLQKLMFVVYL